LAGKLAFLPYHSGRPFNGEKAMVVEQKVAGNITEALQWRRAVKKFDPTRKIEPAVWSEIEKAAILSPSSFGLQPWRFIVVTDQSVKEKLVAASFNQPQPADCSHLLVVARLNELTIDYIQEYIDSIAQVRNVSVESLDGFKSSMVGFVQSKSPEFLENWMARQCYIALGVTIAAASTFGVDTGPMEGFEPAKFDEILGLKEKGLRSLVQCAMGYRAADDAYSKLAKVRFPKEKIVINI
jgi:nitroreductase